MIYKSLFLILSVPAFTNSGLPFTNQTTMGQTLLTQTLESDRISIEFF